MYINASYLCVFIFIKSFKYTKSVTNKRFNRNDKKKVGEYLKSELTTGSFNVPQRGV